MNILNDSRFFVIQRMLLRILSDEPSSHFNVVHCLYRFCHLSPSPDSRDKPNWVVMYFYFCKLLDWFETLIQIPAGSGGRWLSQRRDHPCKASVIYGWAAYPPPSRLSQAPSPHTPHMVLLSCSGTPPALPQALCHRTQGGGSGHAEGPPLLAGHCQGMTFLLSHD